MKLSFFTISVLYILCGCTNIETLNPNGDSTTTNADTLKVEYVGRLDRHRIKENFSVNGNRIYPLIKNDTINLNIEFNKEISKYFNKANFEIKPGSGSELGNKFYSLKRIDNNNFKIFIQD